MRENRCCMCPNYSKKEMESSVCPGISGTIHSKRSTCKFVNVWHDENGEAVFVSSGLGKNNFMSFRRSARGGLHLVKTKFLPVRKNFDEAQTDLNLYAKKKGWKLGQKYFIGVDYGKNKKQREDNQVSG
jgi:hypothetical protein